MGVYVTNETEEATPVYFQYILPPHAIGHQPTQIDFIQNREVILTVTVPATWIDDILSIMLPNHLETSNINLLLYHIHCDAIRFTYDTPLGIEVFHFPLAGFSKRYLIQLVA